MDRRPALSTNPDRVKNQAVLYGWIEELIAERTAAQWSEALDAAGVPNALIQTIAQVLEHPQTKALGILQQSPDGEITLVGLPLSFNGERPAFRRAPPKLGAHTGEIFGEHKPAP